MKTTPNISRFANNHETLLSAHQQNVPSTPLFEVPYIELLKGLEGDVQSNLQAYNSHDSHIQAESHESRDSQLSKNIIFVVFLMCKPHNSDPCGHTYECFEQGQHNTSPFL